MHALRHNIRIYVNVLKKADSASRKGIYICIIVLVLVFRQFLIKYATDFSLPTGQDTPVEVGTVPYRGASSPAPMDTPWNYVQLERSVCVFAFRFFLPSTALH